MNISSLEGSNRRKKTTKLFYPSSMTSSGGRLSCTAVFPITTRGHCGSTWEVNQEQAADPDIFNQSSEPKPKGQFKRGAVVT